MKRHTHDFLGKNFLGDDGSQNMIVYQLTLDILELQKDKDTDDVLSWKSKGYIILNLNYDL